MTDLTETQRRDFEAAAFRRLVEHLRERADVQNIDLMNLAGFCRNCLSNWYREAAEVNGVPLSKVRVVEPGTFTISAGPNSVDLKSAKLTVAAR